MVRESKSDIIRNWEVALSRAAAKANNFVSSFRNQLPPSKLDRAVSKVQKITNAAVKATRPAPTQKWYSAWDKAGKVVWWIMNKLHLWDKPWKSPKRK